jgi:hypothetical protein
MRMLLGHAPRRLLVSIVVATAYLACVQPTLYKTASTTTAPRAANCEFDLVASHPGPGFVEVAQIAVDGPAEKVASHYRDPRAFASEVRPQVCAAGGDVLMTEVNGVGAIVHAIVFRHVEIDPAPGPMNGAPPPAAVAGVCEPICSPGFACNAGTCIPQCNPACGGDETCGNDRLCHPAR